MSANKDSNLTQEQKKKIEENLLIIFKDIFLNNENVLNAKKESDEISEKIKDFILQFAEKLETDETDLLIQAKEKGLELVGNHELIFFEEKIDRSLKMRAFLIPGMKIDITEENAAEKVTEDDLQSVDHELCVSFKGNGRNEFLKLGNLLDIRAVITKSMTSKKINEKNLGSYLKDTETFQNALEAVIEAAKTVV